MNKKMRHGLFYHCEDKWSPDHICKESKGFLLQVDDSVDDEESHQPMSTLVLTKENFNGQTVEEMEVSINAILGLVSSNSMKLLGMIGPYLVDILVDS